MKLSRKPIDDQRNTVGIKEIETKAILNFVIVKGDGFDEGMFTRIAGIKRDNVELRFHTLYKYCYRIFKQVDVFYIEIIEL